jgi:hypothetical protein
MAGRRKPRAEAAKPAPEKVAPDASRRGWLLFIHQVPPKPAYLRVKLWRRLNALGSVALKSTVYVLPDREDTLEDFQWLRREIIAEGADATVCAARFIEGIADAEVEALFNAARDADYASLAEELRRAREAAGPDAQRALHARFAQRLAAVADIDFFAAPGQGVVRGLLGELAAPGAPSPTTGTMPARGTTWCTRRSVHVDRIASAWLIRRFIDAAARFKFVDGDYKPKKGEVRYDMFDAEFTHEGDHCTFEVLLARAGIDDPALAAIAEIVHDLDIKDDKFRRPEAAGIAPVLSGIVASTDDDEARLARGGQLFDDLHRHFSARVPAPKRRKR